MPNDGRCSPLYRRVSLLAKASFCPNFSDDLTKIRLPFANLPRPEMDPTAFEKSCGDAGGVNLYSCINNAICSVRKSTDYKHLSKLRTMAIFITIYLQSQRCNGFQVALSRTLQQFGISEQGQQSLRNLGNAAHPHTVKAKAKMSSASHSSNVASCI